NPPAAPACRSRRRTRSGRRAGRCAVCGAARGRLDAIRFAASGAYAALRAPARIQSGTGRTKEPRTIEPVFGSRFSVLGSSVLDLHVAFGRAHVVILGLAGSIAAGPRLADCPLLRGHGWVCSIG